jgi:DNA-binding NarL/FixJ family response regulator
MRIVIGEDSLLLREGIARVLEASGLDVVGLAGDFDGLLAAVTAERPDVAVIDIRMPPTHTDEGLRAAVSLRKSRPGLGILVFSQYVETHFATELFAHGASGVGYLLKDRVADVGSFVDALTRISQGHTVLDPEVVSQLMGAFGKTGGLGSLTPREREVLELMAEGRSNTAIADGLFLSYGAVEKNVTAIFSKLGLQQSPADHRRVLAVLHYLGVGPTD